MNLFTRVKLLDVVYKKINKFSQLLSVSFQQQHINTTYNSLSADHNRSKNRTNKVNVYSSTSFIHLFILSQRGSL